MAVAMEVKQTILMLVMAVMDYVGAVEISLEGATFKLADTVAHLKGANFLVIDGANGKS
jgi:hypothetical protein